MRFIKNTLAIASALILLFLPVFVLAQDSTEYELLEPLPFVAGSDGVTTTNEYIPGMVKLIIALAGALAVIKIVFGGIQYMSTDAFQKKNDAKSTISNAIWGLVLIISAWLILYTVNPNLVNFNFNIEGQRVGDAFDTTIGSTTPTGAGGTWVERGDCLNCGPVSIKHKSPPDGCSPIGDDKICIINSDLNTKLVNLRDNLRDENISANIWHVTEMFPPTRTHKAPCHSNGTCVDASFIGVGFATPDTVGKFINEASVVGLRAVYEVESESRATELKRGAGVHANNIIVVSGITGEHFSIYLR